jgi:NADPH-dependent curcumin reductase CurA
MRNLMAPVGPGYAPPVPLGGVMVGGTVSEVVASRHAGFTPGERVLANAGWQDYALSDGSDLLALGDMARPSLALGGLGMPGFTAYVGLLDIGQPRPGETVVVAAATGAVGAVVGQLARLKGARVVGIAGGADKCRHAVEVLGFDDCLDRHAADLPARLALACPQGIDVYFENVGGAVFDAVLPLLNVNARVPVCGFISHYNDAAPPTGPDRLPGLMATLLARRIRMQGFIILDHYGERFDAFRRDMAAWLADGRITLREDVVEGLEQAPEALARLLRGGNFGKTVVKVA